MKPESLLNTFSIGDLLRNLFCGIFFMSSWYLVRSYPEFLKDFGESILTVVIPLGLFIGVLIYSIHRSLIYPIIECFFDSKFGKKCRKRAPLIRKASIDITLWRWDSFTENEKDSKKNGTSKVNARIDRWADYIHFQYTSSFCTFLGIIPGLLERSVRCHISSTIWLVVFLLSVSAILFIAAIISDWRLHSFIDRIRDRE